MRGRARPAARSRASQPSKSHRVTAAAWPAAPLQPLLDGRLVAAERSDRPRSARGGAARPSTSSRWRGRRGGHRSLPAVAGGGRRQRGRRDVGGRRPAASARRRGRRPRRRGRSPARAATSSGSSRLAACEQQQRRLAARAGATRSSPRSARPGHAAARRARRRRPRPATRARRRTRRRAGWPVQPPGPGRRADRAPGQAHRRAPGTQPRPASPPAPGPARRTVRARRPLLVGPGGRGPGATPGGRDRPRVGRLGQRAVRGRRSVGGSRRRRRPICTSGMPEPHRRPMSSSVLIGGGRRRVASEAERLRGAPQQRRVADRVGGRQQHQPLGGLGQRCRAAPRTAPRCGPRGRRPREGRSHRRARPRSSLAAAPAEPADCRASRR